MPNEMPEEFTQKELSTRELKGIGRAIADHKKDVLHLHKLPMTAEAAKEIMIAEKRFRVTLTRDLRTLIEVNCSNCPAGYTRSECKAKACPFKTIDNLLNERLEQLNQILPGGI